jgi:hypothetical protein
MTRSDAAGVLLIGSFALWLPLGALPSLYRIWPAPLDEKLALIARLALAVLVASAAA